MWQSGPEFCLSSAESHFFMLLSSTNINIAFSHLQYMNSRKERAWEKMSMPSLTEQDKETGTRHQKTRYEDRPGFSFSPLQLCI